MLRKIYAEIEFDQEVADRYAETNGLDEPTPIDHFGKEFGYGLGSKILGLSRSD